MKSSRFNFLPKLLGIFFVCTALTVLVTSCKDPTSTWTEEEALTAISGNWKGEWENYTIDLDKKTFDAGSYSYAGDIAEASFTNDEKTEGYIYLKYTRAYESTTTEPTGDDTATWTGYDSNNDETNDTWYRYSESAPDVGKYYAVAFKNLTASSVSLSGAYKYNGKSSCETLAEAKTEFTISNGYFATYSELAKSE